MWLSFKKKKNCNATSVGAVKSVVFVVGSMIFVKAAFSNLEFGIWNLAVSCFAFFEIMNFCQAFESL